MGFPSVQTSFFVFMMMVGVSQQFWSNVSDIESAAMRSIALLRYTIV